MHDGTFELIFSLIVMAFVLAGYVIFGAWQCSAQWKHSGLESSYGPIKGCMVKRKDGTWVPEKALRDLTTL